MSHGGAIIIYLPTIEIKDISIIVHYFYTRTFLVCRLIGNIPEILWYSNIIIPEYLFL